MLTNTRTDVIIANNHESERLAGIFGQFVERYTFRDIVTSHKLISHRQIRINKFIDFCFDSSNLLFCRALCQIKINLALFSLNMSIFRPRAAEHFHHRGIEQMLRRMRRFKLLLVMSI